MSVAVISSTGKVLMPTSEYRARKLLKSGKAVKHSYNPFTIQFTQREDGDVQPVEICVDTGYIHIGMSVKSEKHEYLSLQTDTLTDERIIGVFYLPLSVTPNCENEQAIRRRKTSKCC